MTIDSKPSLFNLLHIPSLIQNKIFNIINLIVDYRFKNNGNKPVLLQNNIRMILNAEDFQISKSIFQNRYYSYDILLFLNYFSSFSKVFIDIGSNIGYFTLMIGSHHYKDLKLIAIEPDPINFSFLKKNVEFNNLNVDLHQVAISDVNGTSDFYINKSNFGAHSLMNYNKEFNKSIKVKTQRLDDLFENYNFQEPILIKIDIEGFEFKAMKSAENLLKKDCIIISEFTPQSYTKIGQDPKEYLSFMKQNGYKIYDLKSKKSIIDKEDFSKLEKIEITDLLFFKKTF